MNGSGVITADGEYRDHLTADDSAVLAKRVEAWWHNLGYPSVEAWVEKTTASKGALHNMGIVFAVRSNLKSGKPPLGYGLRVAPLSDGSMLAPKPALTPKSVSASFVAA